MFFLCYYSAYIQVYVMWVLFYYHISGPNIRKSQLVYHNILKSIAFYNSSQSVLIPLRSCSPRLCHLFFLCCCVFVKLLLPRCFHILLYLLYTILCQDSNFFLNILYACHACHLLLVSKIFLICCINECNLHYKELYKWRA
jgi:hypothetical protein